MNKILVIRKISELKKNDIYNFSYILNLSLNETNECVQINNKKIIFVDELFAGDDFYLILDKKVNEELGKIKEDLDKKEYFRTLRKYNINNMTRDNFYWYLKSYWSKQLILERCTEKYGLDLYYRNKLVIERISNVDNIDKLVYKKRKSYLYGFLNFLLKFLSVIFYRLNIFINYTFTKIKSCILHNKYKGTTDKYIITPYSYTTKKVVDEFIFGNFPEIKGKCMFIDEVEPNFKSSIFKNNWKNQNENYYVFSEFIDWKYYFKILKANILLDLEFFRVSCFFQKKYYKSKLLFFYLTVYRTYLKDYHICQNINKLMTHVEVIIALKSRPGILKQIFEENNNFKKIKVPHGIYLDNCYWNRINLDYVIVRNKYMKNMFSRRVTENEKIILLGDQCNNISIGDKENYINNKNDLLLFSRPPDNLNLSDKTEMYYEMIFRYLFKEMNKLNIGNIKIKLHPREDKKLIEEIFNKNNVFKKDKLKILFLERYTEKEILESKYIISVKSSIIGELFNYNKRINLIDFWNEESIFSNNNKLNIISKFNQNLHESIYIENIENDFVEYIDNEKLIKYKKIFE